MSDGSVRELALDAARLTAGAGHMFLQSWSVSFNAGVGHDCYDQALQPVVLSTVRVILHRQSLALMTLRHQVRRTAEVKA